VSRTSGFEAYYLVDAGAGVLVSISLFADRVGAEASTREAAAWVSGHLAGLVQGPPEVLTSEVVGTGRGYSCHAPEPENGPVKLDVACVEWVAGAAFRACSPVEDLPVLAQRPILRSRGAEGARLP
jgi:hypothetical protein